MPHKSLCIGHYQCQCKAGDYAANLAKVIYGMEYAEAQHIDIMTFPESFLTGYFDITEKMRKHSWCIDGPEIKNVLKQTSGFSAVCIVGFNEIRGSDYYNTVLVAECGRLLGTYSKAFPCYAHHTPGRDFPVFEKNGVKYGIIICADGGYIEPCRILALKGARIVFAPHYNYIHRDEVVNHFQRVRKDHAARAVENDIWFLRANSVTIGRDSGISDDGIGYGDSYLMDPSGEIIVHGQFHAECFITATVKICDRSGSLFHTKVGAAALGGEVVTLAEANT